MNSTLNNTAIDAVKSLCTPEAHFKTSPQKPTRLLELGSGPDGDWARLEFDGGWQRVIDLPNERDAWHPMFDDLSDSERSSLRDHARPPVVVWPDGRMTQRGALSCVTRTVSKRGQLKGVGYFDVPDEDLCNGRATGLSVAQELLDALKAGYGPYAPAREIILAAMACSHKKGPSRAWAASALLEVIEDALGFFARNSSYVDYFAQKTAHDDDLKARLASRDAENRAAFVDRMKQARQAKRAAMSRGKS
jgi:hypothetical protein